MLRPAATSGHAALGPGLQRAPRRASANGTPGHPPLGPACASPRPRKPLRRLLTSSRMCSTCSSSSSFLSVSVLFFFSNDWPIRAANSKSRSFCGRQSASSQKTQLPEGADGVNGGRGHFGMRKGSVSQHVVVKKNHGKGATLRWSRRCRVTGTSQADASGLWNVKTGQNSLWAAPKATLCPKELFARIARKQCYNYRTENEQRSSE